MLYALQRYEWFKDVLKRMSTFEQGMYADLLYIHNDSIKMQLYRTNPNISNMMILYAYDLKKEYQIFNCAWAYSSRPQTPNIEKFSEHNYRLTYSEQYKNKIVLKNISLDYENDYSTSVELDYPLQEEQVFQQMTRFDIPEEEYINRFVQISEEITAGFPAPCTIIFRSMYALNEINETNYETVVQSVMECMDGLLEMEQQRIAKNSQNLEA